MGTKNEIHLRQFLSEKKMELKNFMVVSKIEKKNRIEIIKFISFNDRIENIKKQIFS